ncbi:MAG: MarR family winged helix-turn-helix transcriptional regulator [Thermoanaerobaculia bacterium]|nr:MarR family winged helix-turn-helix transcriptional regulator [Thermoanaerobaculia bacterium]
MRSNPGPGSRVEETLGEVLDFMKLLWRLDHALQTASRRMAGSLGVTGPQRLALRVVGKFPGITPGETAAILRLHPSTVTLIVDGLERAGLVGRSEDPEDRRRTRLRLTPAGKTVVARAGGTVEEAMRRTLARVSPGEREAAARLLSELAAELEAPRAPGSSRPAPRRG